MRGSSRLDPAMGHLPNNRRRPKPERQDAAAGSCRGTTSPMRSGFEPVPVLPSRSRTMSFRSSRSRQGDSTGPSRARHVCRSWSRAPDFRHESRSHHHGADVPHHALGPQPPALPDIRSPGAFGRTRRPHRLRRLRRSRCPLRQGRRASSDDHGRCQDPPCDRFAHRRSPQPDGRVPLLRCRHRFARHGALGCRGTRGRRSSRWIRQADLLHHR